MISLVDTQDDVYTSDIMPMAASAQPAKLAQRLIDNQISMLMTDLKTSAEIHLYFLQNELSVLLGDMKEPAIAEAVLSCLKGGISGGGPGSRDHRRP